MQNNRYQNSYIKGLKRNVINNTIAGIVIAGIIFIIQLIIGAALHRTGQETVHLVLVQIHLTHIIFIILIIHIISAGIAACGRTQLFHPSLSHSLDILFIV